MRTAIVIPLAGTICVAAEPPTYYRAPWLAAQAQATPAIEGRVWVQDAGLRHWAVDLDGLPLVLHNGAHDLVALGGGGAFESLDGPESSLGVGELSAVWGSAYATGDFGGRLWWVGYHLTGRFGHPLGLSEATRSLSLGGLGWRLTDNLRLGLAAGAGYGHGRTMPMVLPLVSWAGSGFSAGLLPSGTLELRYGAGPCLALGAQAGLIDYSWMVDDQRIELKRGEAGVFVEQRLVPWTWVRLFASAQDGELTRQDLSQRWSSPWKVGLSLRLVPEAVAP